MSSNSVDTAELSACPMCGGESHITKGYATEQVWPHGDFHRVFCGCCQLRQLFYRTSEEAIAAWNRRTPQADEVRDAALEEAAKACEVQNDTDWPTPLGCAKAIRDLKRTAQ